MSLVVKVFSATKATDRERIGEVVTEWLADRPNLAVTEIRTLQSSDQSYHCLSIIVFGRIGEERQKPLPTAVPGPGVRRG